MRNKRLRTYSGTLQLRKAELFKGAKEFLLICNEMQSMLSGSLEIEQKESPTSSSPGLLKTVLDDTKEAA